MNIILTTTAKCCSETVFSKIIQNKLGFSEEETRRAIKEIDRHLSSLRPNITIIIETDYVDKVYRNSYYSYYATKLRPYKRDCIKLSFFDIVFKDQKEMFDADSANRLKDKYLGFIVLRPTPEGIIGRNVISKSALQSNEIEICGVNIGSTVFGLKCNVIGFPHSSQDGELMTCAETSIWALMKYFGNKYPEYKPILPSNIINILKERTNTRQIPSKGLFVNDISYALKDQGFGIVNYDAGNYTNDPDDFRKIFNCYIDSGIPLVVALSNNSDVNHALLCIGRKKVDRSTTVFLKPPTQIAGGKEFHEWNKIPNEFVFNDDNMPRYQLAEFEKPTAHYGLPNWQECKIVHFIVPLHHKIYLSAEEAIKISNYIVSTELKDSKDVITVRTFLASSRTYRDYIRSNSEMNEVLRDTILRRRTPKFLWVTEISNIDSFRNGKVNGIILLDATSVEQNNFRSLIFFNYKEKISFFDEDSKDYKEFILPLQSEFYAFDKNLNG
ncbi:MAG: hypothetical protein ACK5KT_11460 [Dysgonomonas sp.]